MNSKQASELIEEIKKIRVNLEHIANISANHYQQDEKKNTHLGQEDINYDEYNDGTGGTAPVT